MSVRFREVIATIGMVWWWTLPEALGWPSSRLGAVLGDGRYLRRYVVVGALAPVAALLLGLAFGWLRFGQSELYTRSMFAMATFAVVGLASAALGLYFWAAYVLADFFLYDDLAQPRPFDGLIISYVLLASLMVLIPISVQRILEEFRPLTRRLGQAGRFVELPLQAAAAGLLVYAWTHATPYLIRQVYAHLGAAAEDFPYIPLQRHHMTLVLAAIAAAAVRGVLELWTLSRVSEPEARAIHIQIPFAPSRLSAPTFVATWGGLPPGVRRWLPVATVIAFQATAIAFLLQGLLSATEAALIGLAVVSILAGRLVLYRVAFWMRVTQAIPTGLRLLIGSVLSYYVAQQILASRLDERSFLPVVTAALVGLAIFVALIPEAGGDWQATR